MVGLIVLLIFGWVATTIVSAYVIVNQRETVLTCRTLLRNAEKSVEILENERIKPVCSCGHASSFHNESGCNETLEWRARMGPLGEFASFDKRVKCRCVSYTGPEPLPTYYHPMELT